MDYTGDVGCKETFSALAEDAAAQLVDVRSAAEWNFVGVPDLQQLGKQPLLVEWQVFPAMAIDPEFANKTIAQLDTLGVSKDAPIYFLCRSGVRSQSAAIALIASGYTKAYNVLGGFEGSPDGDRHRGNVNGWKFDGLPWEQR